MSIRFRLTLLYSGILAITLVLFSAALYFIQTQATYDALTTGLARQAQEVITRERRLPRRTDPNTTTPPATPPTTGPVVPVVLPSMTGRLTVLRNANTTVIARTADLGETQLPLTQPALDAAGKGDAWIERAVIDGDPMLVLTQPIMTQDKLTGLVQVAVSMSEREQSLNTLRLGLTGGSLVVILAAFAVGWFLAGMALSPIHRITRTAQAIGAERNFSRRVEHTGPNDEIGQLTVTFNNMLTELESGYHQVEDALQAQNRFVADASHELRTPLTTLRGNIELLRRDPPMDEQERADILCDTKDEVERLIRLVKQLLVLARADSHRTARTRPIAVKPLLQDTARQVKLIAPKRDFELDPPVDAHVLGDSDALKQVLLILIDNAVAHTPPDASIALASAERDGRVDISVRDTGPGIAPELLPHIFERFFRGNVSRTGGGTGLGLAIAKELIEMQAGTIAVTSQPGQGTEFTISLPRAPEI